MISVRAHSRHICLTVLANMTTGLVSVGSDSKVSTLTDFDNLSTQLASVTPTGVNSASYTPSNSPQACPTIDSSWEAVSKLPPTPNNAVCGCMMSNLTCVAKSGLSSDDIQTQFSYICDPSKGSNCLGVIANASTGAYGAYSMCNATERLSYAFNQYYLNQTATNTQNHSPCDFSGTAQKVQPKLGNGCGSVISQAGAAGTGSITSAPSATGGSSGSSGGSGSSSGGSSSSSKAAAGIVSPPAIDFAIFKIAAYVTAAMCVGAGFVMM